MKRKASDSESCEAGTATPDENKKIKPTPKADSDDDDDDDKDECENKYIWYYERNGWEAEVWKTAFPYDEQLLDRYKRLNERFDTIYALKEDARKKSWNKYRQDNAFRFTGLYLMAYKQEQESDMAKKIEQGLKFTTYPEDMAPADNNFTRFGFEIEAPFDEEERDDHVDNSDSGYCDHYSSLGDHDDLDAIKEGLDKMLAIDINELEEALYKNGVHRHF